MASLLGLLWLISLALGASASTQRASLLQARRESVNEEMQRNRARLAEYSKFTEGMVAKYGDAPAGEKGKAWTGQSEISDSGSDLTVENAAADNRLRETIKPNSTEFEAVRMVLQFIDDMTASLLTYHHQDKDQAEQCSQTAILSTCVADNFNDTAQTQIRQAKAYTNNKRIDHQDCREQAANCFRDLSSSCPKYDQYRKNDDKALLPDCVKTRPDEEAFSDKSIQTTDEIQLETFESCLRLTKSWLDPLYNLYHPCRRGEHKCMQKFNDCRLKQERFEDAHCTWKMIQDTECEGVNSCGEEDTSHCIAECGHIADRESYRNADHETGQRLVCLLNVLFGRPVDETDTSEGALWYPPPANKTTALALCKEKTYAPLAEVIDCNPGSWNPPPLCYEDIAQTCSSPFTQAAYVENGLRLPCSDYCSPQDQALNKNVDECQASESCILV